MFDIEVAGWACSMLADPATPEIERLRAAVALRAVAEAAEAQAIAVLAEQHEWRDSDAYDVVGRRPVRVGVDGVLVDETLPLEIAVARGTSVGVAAWLLRDVVNLNARHPHTWQAVQERRVPLWQAQRIAQVCADAGLDGPQTLAVDERLRPALGRVGWARVCRLLRAAMMTAAPEVMREQARRARQARFCRKQVCEQDAGTSYLTAALDTADAIFFDATIDRLADILSENGDPDDKDCRRAKAVGILATPAHALALLGAHSRRGLPDGAVVLPVSLKIAETALPTSQVYVHLHADTLVTGSGVARVEDTGPVFVTELERIVGHSHIKLTPVVHVGDDEPVVDAYEIPDRIRDTVIARDIYEVFPYSSRSARHLDLDHTVAYEQGKPGQTRPSNLGPLSRRAHRAKTHWGWQMTQPAPGEFHWRTGLGQTFHIGPTGTQRLEDTS